MTVQARFPVSFLARALTAILVVAVGGLAPGCHRAVRPDAGGDRTVEAGVPVDFGAPGPEAPVVTWDFGDGSPVGSGARLAHAFARPGTYAVRALERDAVLAQATLTVVPRPVLRAIPPDAEVAVFFPTLRGNVEPLMGFLSRLVGESQVLRTLDAVPFLALVLRESAAAGGEARVVDPDEGLGFFSLPDLEGSVVLLGVGEPGVAMDAVVKELGARGARVVERDARGGVHLRRDSGVSMLLFPDRGYLYLVVPDVPEAEPETGAPQKVLAQVEVGGGLAPLSAVRARIEAARPEGLSEQPMLTALRTKVGAGHLHVFARPEGDDSAGIQGLWAALKFQDTRADLEGWVASDKTLFEGGTAPGTALLEQVPRGPIAALTVSMPPETLAKLAFGSPGSERRASTEQQLARQGLDAAGVEGLLGALRGDLSLLAYLDAAAFYRKMLEGELSPEPRGSVLFQAGLVRSEPVLTWLTQVLQARGQPFQTKKEGAATRLTTRAFDQPVDVTVTADQLTLRGGESLDARARGGVGAALRERFGAGGFEPGHLSAMVDMGRVRAELEAPEDVPGVAPGRLPMARALVGTLLDQLPPVESLFLDFAPESGGGRFRMSTVLRSR